MARMKKFMQMTGSMAMISMYTRQGSDEVIIRMKGGANRTQIETKPEFEKVRLNNKEWQGCTAMGRSIRLAFFTMKSVEDYPVNGSLNALCKQMQHADKEHELGKRSVCLSQHKELMAGFTFSKKQVFESVLRVPVTATLDRDSGIAQIDIPVINTELYLYNFRGLPYFRIMGILGGVADRFYSEVKKEYVELQSGFYNEEKNTYQSEWMPAVGVIPAQSFKLYYPLTINPIPEDITLLLSIGIKFGKMGNDGKPAEVKYAGSGKVLLVG